MLRKCVPWVQNVHMFIYIYSNITMNTIQKTTFFFSCTHYLLVPADRSNQLISSSSIRNCLVYYNVDSVADQCNRSLIFMSPTSKQVISVRRSIVVGLQTNVRCMS